MFESATVKLTGWYLLILMTMSMIFSGVIYAMASNEVQARLAGLQQTLQRDGGIRNIPAEDQLINLRKNQEHTAEFNLFFSLVYINIMVLVVGGVGSYLLAKRTLKPIEEAHEAQSRFVSDASHEFRTPLAVMRMELEVALKEKKISQKEARAILSSNLEEVQRLTALSHTLLQLSRPDSHELTLSPVDLTELVKSAVKRSNRLDPRVALADAPVTPVIVQGDAASLEELAMILIDNALKYSSAGSPVTINMQQLSNHVCLEVINKGEGIATDDLPHIFERFYRADNARSSGENSGFGLGLALARNIVRFHGGELNASSVAGDTTTFTVKIPLASKQKTTKEKSLPRKS